MAIREEMENLKNVSKKQQFKAARWTLLSAFCFGAFAGCCESACVSNDTKWKIAQIVTSSCGCVSLLKALNCAYHSGRCAGAADVAKATVEALEPDETVTIDI